MSSDDADNHPSPRTPLVRLLGIGKAFGRNVVLRGVDLDVLPGECHVLAGENGAGKSTLINILGGVIADYDGDVEIAGEVVSPRSPLHAAALGVAVIHQELSLVPAMSVADNLLLGHPPAGGLAAKLGFVSDRDQRRRSGELLERVGLGSSLVDRQAGSLPVAQQQLVEIAKALSFDAKVVVMDEPTSALPATDVGTVFRLIDRLKSQGRGVIYISHKMDEIDRVADRITVLRDGIVAGSAPASDMSQSELVRLMVGREVSQQFPHEPANPGEVRLRAQGITVAPAGGAANPPVDDVSLEVHGGEVLGLAGLQGSGNSELLLGLFGALGRRTRGTVEVDGKPVNITSIRSAMAAGLALLTNDRKATGLVLPMSVIANSTLADLTALSPGGFRRPGREREAARHHAKAMNLRAASLDVEVGTLSGGNQQKVALAKWLQRNPGVLLLDEPTRGVDVGAKREIYGLINELKRLGTAIVLISTEMPELLGLSDRVAVMHRGTVTAVYDREQATPEKVLAAAMGQHGGAGVEQAA